ncbi:hypothetical protein GGR50DRAFT_653068, partial [Xylaria sp. CBS 124048]
KKKKKKKKKRVWVRERCFRGNHDIQAYNGGSTVGAGDTFIAGILFGFLYHEQDWDQRAKLGFAVQLATCKVQREGFGGLGYEAL